MLCFFSFSFLPCPPRAREGRSLPLCFGFAIALLVGGHGFHLLVMDEVFSDMDVGVMRGSAAIQLLRQREALEGRERLKIVSCTGNSVGESCAHLLEAGADAVWGKPFPNVQDGSMQRRVARLLPDYVV